MTIEFRDLIVTESSLPSDMTKVRQDGFVPDPIWPSRGNERFQIFHLVKGTSEEIEEYRIKHTQRIVDLKTGLDIKTTCMFFAKDLKQFNPLKDAFEIDKMKKNRETGYSWMVTDKWRELIEWTLLPEEIIEKIRAAINPSIEFNVIAFLKSLNKEQMQELLAVVATITDPLSQELIRKAQAVDWDHVPILSELEAKMAADLKKGAEGAKPETQPPGPSPSP